MSRPPSIVVLRLYDKLLACPCLRFGYDVVFGNGAVVLCEKP
jgi:hypothetical protein